MDRWKPTVQVDTMLLIQIIKDSLAPPISQDSALLEMAEAKLGRAHDYMDNRYVKLQQAAVPRMKQKEKYSKQYTVPADLISALEELVKSSLSFLTRFSAELSKKERKQKPLSLLEEFSANQKLACEVDELFDKSDYDILNLIVSSIENSIAILYLASLRILGKGASGFISAYPGSERGKELAKLLKPP
ncbi:MAG: hypothetical protein ABH829_03630 [archaeon]